MATSGTEVINYRIRARKHARCSRRDGAAGSAFRNFDPKIARRGSVWGINLCEIQV
jgi:hypothetical protein